MTPRRCAIYVAAPWDFRDLARVVAGDLERLGYEVSYPWWDHEDVEGFPLALSLDGLESITRSAVRDLDGVGRAAVFVVLNLALSEGKATELGVAIALGKVCVVVGEPSQLFHFTPGVVVVPDLLALYTYLDQRFPTPLPGVPETASAAPGSSEPASTPGTPS
jgi:hypothetical protein